ncbi:hypothetical protein LXL04_035972 [Taraxacum kok-saghyz]
MASEEDEPTEKTIASNCFQTTYDTPYSLFRVVIFLLRKLQYSRMLWSPRIDYAINYSNSEQGVLEHTQYAAIENKNDCGADMCPAITNEKEITVDEENYKSKQHCRICPSLTLVIIEMKLRPLGTFQRFNKGNNEPDMARDDSLQSISTQLDGKNYAY